MDASTIDKRILEYILQFVGVLDYATCSIINHHWNKCMDNEFWRARYYEEGGSTPKEISKDTNWKVTFYDLILNTSFISKLAFAFRKNDPRLTRGLIKKRLGMDPPMNLTDKNYLFVMAAAIGNVEATRVLLKELPDIRVDAKIEYGGYSALQFAVNHLNYDMAKYLIEEVRVNVNSSPTKGHTPVYNLILKEKVVGFNPINERGHMEQLIVHAKWDKDRAERKRQNTTTNNNNNNDDNNNNKYPITGWAHVYAPDTMYSYEIWSTDTRRADVMQEICNGSSPRHLKDPDLRFPMLELLFKHQGDRAYAWNESMPGIDLDTVEMGNALHWSIALGDKVLTKWLLENFYPRAKELRVEHTAENTRSANSLRRQKRVWDDYSYLACASQEMLIWLITEGGMDINSVSVVHDCPVLHIWMENNNFDFVRKLITEYGAKVHCGQHQEHILFHLNAYHYEEGLYLFLREHGARIDTQFWQKHLAHFSAYSNINYMKRLIADGYDMSYVDFIGRTVADKVDKYCSGGNESLKGMNEYFKSIGAPTTDLTAREKKYGRYSWQNIYPPSYEPMRMKVPDAYELGDYAYQYNPPPTPKRDEKCICM